MRLTLKEAREALYDAVTPEVATPEGKAEFLKYINFAQERLINSGKWQGTLRTVLFVVDEQAQTFTLPRRIVSALACKFENSGWVWPGRIQNVWYSYLPYTQNLQDRRSWANWGFGTSNFSDEGDGHPTVFDSPFEFYKVRASLTLASDAGKYLYFKGNDCLGNPIYSMIDGVSTESVRLTLANPTVTSVQVVKGPLTFVTKDLTDGYVDLEYVEVVAGVETGLTARAASYEPGETTISLRKYRAYTGWNTSGLSAICKLRYVAAQTDTDEIVPANLGALRNALAGLKYEAQNDPGRRDEAFDTAYKLLNDELKESMGGAQFKLRLDEGAYQLSGCYFGM